MDQQLSEKIPGAQADIAALEASLTTLWDRARSAADRLTHFREENRALRDRVRELEEALRRLEEHTRTIEEQLNARPPEQAPAPPAEASPFANGEREAIVGKVKDLLTKLDAYL